MKNFFEKLENIIDKNKSLICVGLDSDLERIPDKFKKEKYPQYNFNKYIIDNTFDLVCLYKLNTAFYEAIGYKGIKELKMTCDYLRKKYPEIPIIIDAKRADIGNTNKGYVSFVFEYLKADAVTVNPYLGKEALMPFLEKKDKGIIVLCKTSNIGSDEFQNLKFYFQHDRGKNRILPLYAIVAERVVKYWNKNKNCALVVGATYPQELKKIRKIVGEDMWILVPGIGQQGGDIEAVLKAGLNKKRKGIIINISRNIIFAKNPRKECLIFKNKIKMV